MAIMVFKIISCQFSPFLNSLNFVGFLDKLCIFSEGVCLMLSIDSVSRNLSMCAVERTTHLPSKELFKLKRANKIYGVIG